MTIQRVAIAGLGTMGPGMAARFARAGLGVSVHDIAKDAVDRAPQAVALAQSVLDRLNVAPPAGGDGAVRYYHSLAEAVAGADLVIENVPENIGIKARFYQSLDPLIGAATLVASDTSGIPITKLQAYSSSPGRFAGMHWSNPPHIIPMIEVISGEHTAPETAQTIVDLIRAMGLLPVVLKKDVPGFVENRILYALLREAVDLVETGVIDADDLDTCVSWGIGYKLSVVGPMALLDMAGLDVYQSVASFLNAELCDRKDVPDLIKQLTKAGKLGMKTGEGLQNYAPERKAALQAARARRLIAVRRALEERE
jgi:3-hydroxybutyryl-CoA dehydrogenase/5-formyl-3-hydroxy-2-methylpyridine 4-carboxylate dehydrogenase